MRPNRMDDAELAETCQREFGRLVGLLALRVGDQRIAEELAQEALLALCREWPDVERPEAWLTRVALNQSHSHVRRLFAQRRAYARHRESAPASEQLPSAEVLTVRDAVSRLPRRQQAVIVLRFYEQMSVAEAADVMGCPQGTVRSLTSRALQQLRGETGLSIGREEAAHNG